MIKLGLGTFAAAMFLVLTGCATVRSPLNGGLYSSVTSGMSATSNQAGSRVGEACATSILGIIATGDASIETARRNGGITMITSVDEASSNILTFYAKYCTIVRGR
jgi:hypothetical protein